MGPSTVPSAQRSSAVPTVRSTGRWLAGLTLCLLVVSLLHYLTPLDLRFYKFHDIWDRLYYVPIVMGAFAFGLRGAVGTGLAATLLYLPHVLFQWGHTAHGARPNQYLEMVMFNVIGVVTGVLAEGQRRRREETRRAYEQLAASFERTKEAERLAAMGQLSAALAHEIRNPLASLQGSLPILLEAVPPDDARREFAVIARREIQRLEELTTQILEYARPSPPRWALDSLNDLARNVARLVEQEARRRGVALRLALDEQLPLASMDSNRMTQVILNLALNGIQASGDGGELALSTSHDETSVVLRVCDRGPGLSPEAREHLFEPFFTTKTGGTGLGLAVVYQWVRRHGGSVEVEDQDDDSGTCFVVRLPQRATADASADAAADATANPTANATANPAADATADPAASATTSPTAGTAADGGAAHGRAPS
jgi:two-component system sensor histidine kinase HydH